MTNEPATFGRPFPRHVAWRQGLLTKFHTLVYCLSGGRLGVTLLGMPMLLLTTWGRRTSKLRTTPLLYLPVDDVFVLVASNGGALHHPIWWFNLQAHPDALVQIGPTRGRVQAVAASPDERRRFWRIISILWGTLYADAHEAPKSRSFARWVIRSANDGSAYRPEMRSWI